MAFLSKFSVIVFKQFKLISNYLRSLGTKSDLRVQGSEKFVTTVEGKKLKNKIGAFTLVECSAKKKTNLVNVFEEAIRAVERKKPGGSGRKQTCCIL